MDRKAAQQPVLRAQTEELERRTEVRVMENMKLLLLVFGWQKIDLGLGEFLPHPMGNGALQELLFTGGLEQKICGFESEVNAGVLGGVDAELQHAAAGTVNVGAKGARTGRPEDCHGGGILG